MTRLSTWLVALLAVCTFTTVGCGEGGSAATAIPATPDGTVLAVANNLAKNQPRAVWDAMPEQWQADVTSLVSTFADKMDAEVYNKTFAVTGKLADVLANKKALVLQLMDDPELGQAMPVQKADVEARYDTIVSFVGAIAKSDAATIDGLKKLDIGKFLGTTGAKLMNDMDRIAELAPDANDYQQNKAKLAATRVEVISSTDTTASVRVTSGDDVEEVEMAKVGGKWVPKEMADDWDAKIAEAREGLAQMTGEQLAQNKPQVMALLNSIDTGLTTMGKADTKEELKQAVMGVVGTVMAQVMGGMGAPDNMGF